MNLLLDTHIMIWFITDDRKLSKKIKNLIEDSENNCFISIASFWELAIKDSLKRLDLNVNLQEIFQLIYDTGLEILPITVNHIFQLSKLEHHHNDPFDRILIAQSIDDSLTLISKDAFFPAYGIELIS